MIVAAVPRSFAMRLLRVDYSRWAVANEFALAIPPQTVNTVSVSTTMTAPAKLKQAHRRR
jgi:hypothetical protein